MTLRGLVTAALVVGGCGGDDSAPGGLSIEVSPDTLPAIAGREVSVAYELRNSSGVQLDVSSMPDIEAEVVPGSWDTLVVSTELRVGDVFLRPVPPGSSGLRFRAFPIGVGRYRLRVGYRPSTATPTAAPGPLTHVYSNTFVVTP